MTDITDDDRRTAAEQVEHLCSHLDITNADHIALWLECNPDCGLPWLACRIVEAHEASLAAAIASERAAVVQLRKAAARLIEFVDGPREQQRPDVWWLRVAALRRAIERGDHSDQAGEGEK